MRKLFASILIIFSLLFGCSSSFTVQVDIFNPKGLDPEDVKEASVDKKVAQHIYQIKTGNYSLTKNNLKSQLRQYLEKLARPEVAVVKKSDVTKFASESDKRVEKGIDNVIRLRDEGVELSRKAEALSDLAKRAMTYGLALGKFADAQKILIDLKTNFLAPFQGLLKNKLAELEKETTPDQTMINRLITFDVIIDRNVEKSLQTLTGGLDLFDDPLAPFVVSAPDQYWKGSFNTTHASGQFGNTDIAIKMETIGTFTIKGVRLDAAKVTQASFQLLKQSVKLVAAAYGVPTPGGTPSPAEEQSPDSPNKIVMNIDQLRQTADLKRQKSQYAALSLLDIIILEKSKLLSEDDTIRKTAVNQLKKSFEAYKLQLSGE